MLMTKLDNGLEIVLKEDRSARVVAVQIAVGVGSMHETTDERGLAHFIEHMIFKGSESFAPGEMATIIESCGGDVNAYTTFDNTTYYANLVSNYAKKGVTALLDSLLKPKFDETEFLKEKEVIIEEIKRGLDSPDSKLGHELFALCYPKTEVGRPVIGSVDSVSGFRVQNLVSFYRKWYHPENMSLTIVGDFDKCEMLDHVVAITDDQIFEKILIPNIPFHRFNTEKLEVRLLEENYNNLRVEIAFPGPELESFDSAMLDLAAFALGSGDSSRLVRELKYEQNLVAAISASSYTPSFPGLFTISAFVPAASFLEAIEAIGVQLKKLLQGDPVTKAEIDRAKSSHRIDRAYRDELVDGQARALSFGLKTRYKVHFDSLYAHQIDIAEPEAVDSVVRKWLKLDQAKIVAMVPQDFETDAQQIENAYLKGVNDLSTPSKVATEPEKDGPEGSVTTTHTLDNGHKLIYRQNKHSKQFSLATATHGGLRLENSENTGIYNFLSGLLGLQSENYSYDEILRSVEGMGATLEGFSGKDSFGLSMHCLAEQVGLLLPIFCDCFERPVFPKNHFNSIKTELAEIILSHKDSPSSLAMRRFSELLFGEEHPYSRPSYGSMRVLDGLNVNELGGFYSRAVKTQPWVFSCVSPLPPIQVVSLLNETLKSATVSEKSYFEQVPKARKISEQIQEHIELDREQTHVVFGFSGKNWADKQRPALDVLISILGGHSGRLFLNLREKQSLAYSVSPVNSYGYLNGAVGAYLACSPEKVEEAIEMLRNEFRDLSERQCSEEELGRAKNWIIGQHHMDMQKPDSQAMTMCLMELYGVGYDDFLVYPKRVEAVSPLDVQKIAVELFEESKPLIVTCGR